jgi:hypothetical protein
MHIRRDVASAIRVRHKIPFLSHVSVATDNAGAVAYFMGKSATVQ